MNAVLSFIEPQVKQLEPSKRARLVYTAAVELLLLLIAIGLQQFHSGALWGRIFFGTLVFGLLFLLLKCLLTRSWDRWNATGFTRLVVERALSVLGAAVW